MLFSSFAAVPIVMVRAPVSEPIIMWAVVNNDPYDGYYGGYWDAMTAIQASLKDIGIDMRIVYYDAYTWWDIVWNSYWNVPGDADGHPETYTYCVDGWDISIDGWRLNPTSYIWLDPIVGSWNLPPNGYNIISWLNPKADNWYMKAQATLDPVTHKKYMWLWQAEFMHDCPSVILYYPEKMGAQASYFDGYDMGIGWYTRAYYDINETKFYEVLPADDPAWATRRAIGPDTLLWGADHPIWTFFPLYTMSYTDEHNNVMMMGMLYRPTRENLMTFPTSGKYLVEPELADGFPTWGQLPDGRWYANITLKQSVTWTDGVPFNASDFAFTVNHLNLIGVCLGSRTFYMWDHADVLEPYKARIVYKPGLGPDYDLAGYMAHGWAWSMLPWHQLKDTDPLKWKVSTFATDPFPDSSDGIIGGGTRLGLERLGPYVPIEWVSPNYLKMERRDAYCDALRNSTTGAFTNLPKYYAVKVISNKAARFVALQKLEVDYCEYAYVHQDIWPSMEIWPPTHKVNPGFFMPEIPTLWLNHRNPILSNRYVRLAIAHAIPYPKIFANILPGWGISKADLGKTWVMPVHESFDTELGNYEYNITRARQYMDMWRYSQAYTDYTKGPVGDHDLSGYVEIVDFPVWARWFGTYATKDPLYPYPDKWPYIPGNDRDPDNDNNGYVEMKDFTLWASNFGKSYPYPGAW